jgi:diacylglycerol kinase family enzyme
MRVTTCFTGRSKEKDWEGAFREPIDRAIVAGGDGTVSRLAPWLAGRNTAFCILPLGTANNCARGLGQMHSIETIITQLNSAPIRKIDLGAITSSAGHRFFIESAGIGLLPLDHFVMVRIHARQLVDTERLTCKDPPD